MRPHVQRLPLMTSYSAMPACPIGNGGACNLPIELVPAYTYRPEHDRCVPPQPLLRGLNSMQIVDGESEFRLCAVYANVGCDLDCAYENLQM